MNYSKCSFTRGRARCVKFTGSQCVRLTGPRSLCTPWGYLKYTQLLNHKKDNSNASKNQPMSNVHENSPYENDKWFIK